MDVMSQNPHQNGGKSKKYVYVAKKESEHKRETRSRHEKKRREEMNEVFAEMMELLPEEVQKDVFKIQKADQKPKKPDKCFIISHAVDFIKNNVKKSIDITDPITEDVYDLTNCFVLTLRDLIVQTIEGDHRVIFDLEKFRMIGKDFRCFVDFDSARKLSFLKPTLESTVCLRSFMAKSMICTIKQAEKNPSELILVCIPDITQTVIPPTQTTVIPAAPPSKLEAERPILAALLRRKDPPDEEMVLRREKEMRECREREKEMALKSEVAQRRQRDRHVSWSQVHVTPILHCDSASTSGASFLSPSSCTSSHPPITKKLSKKEEKAAEKMTKKRLRSMNAIVESYSLDEIPEPKKKKLTKKEQREQEKALKIRNISSTTTPTLTTLLPSIMTTPVTVPTTTFINPIPSTSNIHPYDVLAPNYKDIWLRLQSERLLLEERIVAKEGELKNLMLTARTLPQYFPTLPNYNFAQSTLDILHQL